MLEQLRGMVVFAKTVELGSFRGAAKALALSPSVVSHHVARLEESLGVVLLYRSTRRLALTEDGKKMLEASQAMIAAAAGGLNRVALHSRSPSGVLRITAPAALSAGPVADAIASFAIAFPNVKLSLSFSDAPIDMIKHGVDVAIRAGDLKSSSLKSKKLFSMPRTLVASPIYLASRAKPAKPIDLASCEWLQLASRRGEIALSSQGRKVKVAFTARFLVDDAGAIHELARRGLGVCALPSAMVAADLRDGRLVELLAEWRLDAPNVYAIWPGNASRAGLAMRFVDQFTSSTPRNRSGEIR